MRVVSFQDFSLPGQSRDDSSPLAEILGDEGVSDDSRIGVVGWKTYATRDVLEVPAFLVDALAARRRPEDSSRTRWTF